MSLGAILAGALIALAVQLLFAALGSGVGLATFALERGETPDQAAGIGLIAFAGFSLLVSFFLGGFVASRLARAPSRSMAFWHSVGAWSIVVLAAAWWVGSAVTSLGRALVTSGVGAGATLGASQGADEITRQLGKVRIVTDLKILKGKAVTQFEIPGGQGSRPQQAGEVARSARRDVKKAAKQIAREPVVRREARQAAGEARKIGAGASWAAFGAMALSLLAAAAGGLTALARRRSPA